MKQEWTICDITSAICCIDEGEELTREAQRSALVTLRARSAELEHARSPAESCLEERKAGNGPCGACSICCGELRARVEDLENAIESETRHSAATLRDLNQRNKDCAELLAERDDALVALACCVPVALWHASGPLADAMAWLDEPTPQADVVIAGLVILALFVVCLMARRGGNR